MDQIEEEFRKALGLLPERKNVGVARPDQLLVCASVRHSWGGRPFTFRHIATTPFRTEAELEARRAVRNAGLSFWCLLSVEIC